MAKDPVREIWEESQGTWPLVTWSLEAYRSHMGDTVPTYPQDLYIAGAAGCRISEAWSSIDEAFRMMVTRKLATSARADLEPEDLWSESVARLMRADPESGHTEMGEPLMHITRYRGMTRLPWYFLATARTIAIDRHRRLVRDPKQYATEFYEDVAQSSHLDDPAVATSQLEQMDVLMRSIVDAFHGLSSNHQFLLSAIYRDRMSKADAGSMIGLSPWQTSRELRKAEEHMRLRVEHALPREWDTPTKDAWSHGWEQCWRVSEAGLDSKDRDRLDETK